MLERYRVGLDRVETEKEKLEASVKDLRERLDYVDKLRRLSDDETKEIIYPISYAMQDLEHEIIKEKIETLLSDFERADKTVEVAQRLELLRSFKEPKIRGSLPTHKLRLMVEQVRAEFTANKQDN